MADRLKIYSRPANSSLVTYSPTNNHRQGRRDLNPQPLVLETSALPIELHPWVKIAKLAIRMSNEVANFKSETLPITFA